MAHPTYVNRKRKKKMFYFVHLYPYETFDKWISSIRAYIFIHGRYADKQYRGETVTFYCMRRTFTCSVSREYRLIFNLRRLCLPGRLDVTIGNCVLRSIVILFWLWNFLLYMYSIHPGRRKSTLYGLPPDPGVQHELFLVLHAAYIHFAWSTAQPIHWLNEHNGTRINDPFINIQFKQNY